LCWPLPIYHPKIRECFRKFYRAIHFQKVLLFKLMEVKLVYTLFSFFMSDFNFQLNVRLISFHCCKWMKKYDYSVFFNLNDSDYFERIVSLQGIKLSSLFALKCSFHLKFLSLACSNLAKQSVVE
jgi:hypothetical protein